MKTRRSAAQWAELVAAWDSSGLSGEAFASERGLVERTLRWWMRWSFERLSGVVKETVGDDARSGALFVFYGRRKDALKVLFFDGSGMAIFYKRFDRGVLRLPTDLPQGTTRVELDDASMSCPNQRDVTSSWGLCSSGSGRDPSPSRWQGSCLRPARGSIPADPAVASPRCACALRGNRARAPGAC